ncbi:acyl-CoA thioesterase [Neisseria gonorrhoeae]|uniref:acyl-CoA thioesterase n=1 Tax=Neisseria gonorrhoeae TaxID=485 RepID=UPI001F37FEE1|nr:thioesterase family protein [Neisseria gonorrhoeae]MCF2986282.1 acyl-CoA thioesterase [Neisseria gonorrhoeae]
MKLTVRNYHLDGYGHVNNARYLEFLEEARWAFFEKRGLMHELAGLILIVARIDIRYSRPAVEGDVLQFSCRPGMRRIVLTQTITLPNGKTAAEADITLMPVHAATQRTVSLPATLARALEALSE